MAMQFNCSEQAKTAFEKVGLTTGAFVVIYTMRNGIVTQHAQMLPIGPEFSDEEAVAAIVRSGHGLANTAETIWANSDKEK